MHQFGLQDHFQMEEQMLNEVQALSNTSVHNNVFRDVTLGLKEIIQRAIMFQERIISVKN